MFLSSLKLMTLSLLGKLGGEGFKALDLPFSIVVKCFFIQKILGKYLAFMVKKFAVSDVIATLGVRVWASNLAACQGARCGSAEMELLLLHVPKLLQVVESSRSDFGALALVPKLERMNTPRILSFLLY